MVYEEFIQSWILQISCNLEKLGQWDSTVNWSYDRCLKLQKQTLAERLKNIKLTET